MAEPTTRWLLNELTLFYTFGYQVFGFARETWARGVLLQPYAAVFSFMMWTPALLWACFTVFRTDWIFHTPHVTGVEPEISPSRVDLG